MIPRRVLLLGTLAACTSRKKETPPPSIFPSSYQLQELSFDGEAAAGGSTRAVLLAPKEDGPFPVLIALHGRGEAVRGAEAGAYGWVKDYLVSNAIEALHRGRLNEADFQHLVTPTHLAEFNHSLAQEPYRGVALVCPHAPDFQGKSRDQATERYGDWLVTQLLPQVMAKLGEKLSGQVGIDGVSMGGRMALQIGLAHPKVFSAVGSLQAAIRAEDAVNLVQQAASYLREYPPGKIRILTSDGDFFRDAILKLDQEWTRAGLSHECMEAKGPHNYLFNQGPGSIEMLRWHDLVLRKRG